MRQIAFVVKGYPRLSETFIAQEILALQRRGLAIGIFSLRRPTERLTHEMHGQITAPVIYLPEYLYREPLRVLRGWWRARRLPGYGAAKAQWRRDLARDFSANRGRRFGQALVLAAEMRPDFSRLHAHFLHTPGSVARYGAMLRGLPWSFSAHAKDIWTTPQWELREKIAEAEWGTVCSAAGLARLRAVADAGPARKLALNYHGLDLTRFPPPPEPSMRDGGDAASPVIIASVGRAVHKKGIDVLLRALAALPRHVHWRLLHIGDGPLLGELRALAQTLGVAQRIEWRGAADQAAVIESLRRADLFALAARVAPDGDRDGLPNVLLEAQSQALACVASNISAIPEFIVAGETGLLTPPADATALALALAALIGDPARRARLGAAGRARLEQQFELQQCIGALAQRLAQIQSHEGA